MIRIFAYGSNMCLPHLTEWSNAAGLPPPTIVEATSALLSNYRLAWNYRSRRSCGAANVVAEAGQLVHGVLITTDADGLATIDRKEGTPIYYARTLVSVEASGRAFDAWVYQVTERYVVPAPVWPDRTYLELLLAGARAHDLPTDYVSLLASLPVIEAA